MESTPWMDAVTFIRPIENSRTCPSLFYCEDTQDRNGEYVVKFYRELGPRINCEYIAACLGRVLGLPIPEIAVVEIPQDLIENIPVKQVKQQLTGSSGPHFGSLFQGGGYAVQPYDLNLPETQRALALDVFAFDMLIRNTDRSGVKGKGKPNILGDGENFILIDHELSFSFIHGDEIPDPCAFRKESFVRTHIFYKYLCGQAKKGDLHFEECFNRFSVLNRDIVLKIVSQMPKNWYNGRYKSVGKITEYLESACADMGGFERAIREVIA